VDTVGKDPVAGLRWRVTLDQRVPRALLVENHRSESTPRREPLRPEDLRGDRPFPAPQRLEPERGGEPARRVDGEHDGAPPLERAPQRERGGDGRLADAAAAGGGDDLVPRDEIGDGRGP